MSRAVEPRAGGNLGATRQPARRRRGCPMARYDALPPPLRQWLAQAALPWSPSSCRRLWRQALAAGASPDEAIERLNRAEQAALRRAV